MKYLQSLSLLLLLTMTCKPESTEPTLPEQPIWETVYADFQKMKQVPLPPEFCVSQLAQSRAQQQFKPASEEIRRQFNTDYKNAVNLITQGIFWGTEANITIGDMFAFMPFERSKSRQSLQESQLALEYILAQKYSRPSSDVEIAECKLINTLLHFVRSILNKAVTFEDYANYVVAESELSIELCGAEKANLLTLIDEETKIILEDLAEEDRLCLESE